MRWSAAALWFFVACGAGAGALVTELVPVGLRGLQTFAEHFHLARATDDHVEITPARWFFLPFLFGDFDLQMDIELAAGTEVDVLLRQVEPRLVGSELLPFAGRFTVLRLSAERTGRGDGWRTRDEALFGPHGGGVDLDPGRPATLWIEARGRLLRANVAGKAQALRVADDAYGMFTVLARGGNAVLHRLEIAPRPARRWLWWRSTWAVIGALGAAVVLAIAHALGARPQWLVGSGIGLLLLAGWFAGRVDLELGFPEPAAMLLTLAGCLGAALAGLLAARPWQAALTLVAAAWLLFAVHARLGHDSRAVDAAFGPNAGAEPAEALGQLVRGRRGLYDVGRAGPRVFLLGGQLLYDRGTPAEHLELVLGRELRAVLGRPVDVPCLPTVDGHAQQQWSLFERFYRGYRPEVVVLGVGQLEDVTDEATGLPRSSPDRLTAVVQAALVSCRAEHRQLMLFADVGVAEGLLRALQRFADDGVPLVVARPDEPPTRLAQRLAAVILPFLR